MAAAPAMVVQAVKFGTATGATLAGQSRSGHAGV
jgi:hypothetical protein